MHVDYPKVRVHTITTTTATTTMNFLIPTRNMKLDDSTIQSVFHSWS